MILYDQNYNFIGMSNETLSYLGYEDLADFTSQHSDFANLLANKEGYIYKFQNFSWIDFILYSGSPNKSALLKLKNGDELEIKLSVKEVYLTTDINGNDKFYSVRILSDNFVNIASKTDASIAKQSPAKNSFNLNSLITEDEITPTPAIESAEAVAVASPEAESQDFVLNFPSSESLKESESSVKIDLSEKKEDDFILTMPDEEAKTDGDIKLNFEESAFDEVKEEPMVEEKPNEFTLNFLKSEDTTEAIEEVSPSTEIVETEQDLNPIQTQEIHEQGFVLKMHDEKETEKTVSQQEEEGSISLNFLKKEEEESDVVPESEQVNQSIQEVPVFNNDEPADLNFLQKAVPSEEEASMEPANKQQIISQIKHDIEEIDAVQQEEKTPSFLAQGDKIEAITEEAKELQFPDLDANLFNKNEVKKEKKSFTKTLKSLFADTSDDLTQEPQQSEFSLLEEPAATLKKNDAPQAPLEEKKVAKEEHPFSGLAFLGLSEEEEHDLIIEFIHDTKSNIQLFKQYQQSANLDQAEYALIKMQSSADILNLNDIIMTLSEIKQACNAGSSESIDALTHKLESQVNVLENYLESETV